MFQLENVSKVYSRRGHEVVAFQAASLNVDRGEYVAVVGPSGCGKTTLLSLLGGMLSPDTGTVRLDGESLYHLTVAERTRLRCRKIGFVFQTFNLVPYLSALENVQIPLFLRGASIADQVERARKLLADVGLESRLEHKPCELSTGQQQRVALARTLANDPAVILADEPTGNLDPESREMVLAMFDRFAAEGRTLVMVTHDPLAARRAVRTIQLRDGAVTDNSANARLFAA